MSEPTLIQQLRDPGAYISSPSESLKMCRDAADEIERLLCLAIGLLAACKDKSDLLKSAYAKIEQLEQTK